MRTVAQKCVSKVWMPVFGYEETYQVSENGEFRNIKTNRMMKVNLSLHSGYVSINLCKNGKATLHRVHKLVLISFGYLPNRNQQCRHLDGDKSNNNLGNLRWGTQKENERDKARHGRVWHPIGEKNNNAKLNRRMVMAIYQLRRTGCNQYEIAELVGINQSQISRILNGKAWQSEEATARAERRL